MKVNISNWIGVLCLAAAPAVLAQPCPDKNLLYWQAFPPGGESDISARHQQMVLKKKCAAIDTIIQYKAGGGGALLWSQMNSMAGDGTQIMGVNLPHLVLQPIEGNVSYKTDDVTPVFWYHYTPDALVVPENSPFKTFADFIKAAKASPGKFSYGSSGVGTALNLAGEMVKEASGAYVVHIPYRGAVPALTDLMGGQIQLFFDAASGLIAQGKAGRVRLIGVSSDRRLPAVPDVPTFIEQGFAGFTGSTWAGMLAPAATPKDIVKRMSDEVVRVIKSDETRVRLDAMGTFAAGSSPEEFDGFITSETAKWAKVIKDAGVKAD